MLKKIDIQTAYFVMGGWPLSFNFQRSVDIHKKQIVQQPFFPGVFLTSGTLNQKKYGTDHAA